MSALCAANGRVSFVLHQEGAGVSRWSRFVTVLAVLLLASLSGCGKKGPLYLPDSMSARSCVIATAI